MMIREPAFVPSKPGVFALVNRRRRFAYVSWTKNLQKRSHSMSHMLLAHDAWQSSSSRPPKRAGAEHTRSERREKKKSPPYWPIKDLPKHPSDEFAFVVHEGVGDAPVVVGLLQKQYLAKGYRIIGGHRTASLTITLNSRRMTLAEALKAHPGVDYLTAYRRLQRGWTARQAIGLDPPDARWDTQKQDKRRARQAERSEARELPS